MKLFNIILLTILVFAYSAINAQDSEDDYPKGLISDNVEFSGYGIVYTNISTIRGKKANYFGGGAVIAIQKRLLVGAFGTSLISKPQIEQGEYEKYMLRASHMGMSIGYIFMHQKKIHPILSVYGAVGGLSLITSDYNPVRDFYDNISTINPTLEIEYKISKYFRASIGGQYSHFFGVSDLEGFSNKDFRKGGIYLGFKVGV